MKIIKIQDKKRLSRPTWAEIDLRAIHHNFKQIKKLAGKKTNILTVIKADAYGHGMVEVARIFDKAKVNYFGVSSIKEGVLLREKGIRKPVLLFGNILTDFVSDLFKYNITPTVSTLDLAKALSLRAKNARKKINIHIKIDTGMGRLGVWHKEAFKFINTVSRLPGLCIEGIYTHFPVADTDRRFTDGQIQYLFKLIRELDRSAIIIKYVHAANSMGLIDYPDALFNLVRPGLALYGLYPREGLGSKIRLKPTLSVKSKITFLKEIARDRSISYGRTFISKSKRKIATVPIGYNDGYMRLLSNKAFVLVRGLRCPVVGRITMDQIMVDVTKVRSPKIGEEVVILGRQRGSSITADELAKKANTISYEIICSLGNRLPRIYKK